MDVLYLLVKNILLAGCEELVNGYNYVIKGI